MRLGLATRTTVYAIKILEAIQVIAKNCTLTHPARTIPDSWACIQRCVCRRLIRNSYTYNQYDMDCSLINHADMNGNVWYYHHICKNKKSIRHGS
uniref:Uncharacterized protein n=1 Tax=Octopus bimaculoides TaxID=37653 RepID=A0A0L8HGI9_OCTBM